MKEFDNLKAYLPSVVISKVLELANSEKNYEAPVVQDFETVSLFADVSGFTPLSEALSAYGPEGIEELASQLNKYVGQLVKLTSRAGGDVLKFAGDAMLALWPPMQDEELANSVQRAIQCALDMQLRLKNYYFKFNERGHDGKDLLDKVRYEGVLNVKIGIGVGKVQIVHMGGCSDNVMNERYEYVALGEALEQAFNSESFAKPGQVIVSKKAFAKVKQHFESVPVKESRGNKCQLVTDWKSEIRWKKNPVTSESEATNMGERLLWKYVPAAVMPYLHESNEFWAPELRRVTTLFCSIGLSEKDHRDLEKMQDLFLRMQQSVFQYEGTINKFLVDDKGTSMIAVFGLPPFAHENDATRGVLSAMSVLSHMHEVKKVGAIGLTTGVAFCGVVGTRGNRREYSVIGDVVNLSARLMVTAKEKKLDHLMDGETASSAREDLTTRHMGSVDVKGKNKPVPVYVVNVDNGETGADDAGGKNAPNERLASVRDMPLASPKSNKERMDRNPKGRKNRKKATDKAGLLSSAVELDPSKRSTNVMAKTQREQVANITQNPKLRKDKEKASAAAKTQNGGDSGAKESDERLAGAIESFVSGGVPNGSSAPQAKIDTSRPVRAAKVRFDNCATTSNTATKTSSSSSPSKSSSKSSRGRGGGGGDGGGQRGSVDSDSNAETGDSAATVNFTVAVTEDMKTIHDLKVAALDKLRARKLLLKPDIDPGYFTIRRPSEDTRIPEATDLREFSEVANLVLKEHHKRMDTDPTASDDVAASANSGAETKDRNGDGHGGANQHDRSTAQTYSEQHLLKEKFEATMQRLVRDGLGTVVMLEGAHGVGKSRIVREVFLEGAAASRVCTAVAAGNPYETATLSKDFSVWTVLLEQFLEESLAASGFQTTSSNDGDQVQALMNLIREAVYKADANFDDSELELLDQQLGTTFGFVPPPSFPSPAELENRKAEAPVTSNDVDEKTLHVMKTLLKGLAISTPLLAIVDDSHFMDIASWTLTKELAKDSQAGLLIVLLHRSLILSDGLVVENTSENTNVDVFEGVDRHNMRAIENNHTRRRRAIANMVDEIRSFPDVVYAEKLPNPEQTEEIICDALGVTAVPVQLVSMLRHKSRGNALFIRDACLTYLEHNLIVIRGHHCELTKEFEDMSKYYELPVPSAVEGICSTLLDTMSTTQQMALKVAAMIGETFTLHMVRSVFPISALKSSLDESWQGLEKMRIIELVDERELHYGIPENADPSYHASSPKHEVYTFINGWMLETLRNRMLSKQKRKLNEIYKLIVTKEEEANRRNYIKANMDKNTANMQGWLHVRKDNARNMLKPWKKRWCVLEGEELVQYYDETNPKRLEVIMLSAKGTRIRNRVGGFMGYELNLGEKLYPFCFTISAVKWYKKGIEVSEARDFFMAPESQDEQQQWVFKLGFQIDFYQLEEETKKQGLSEKDQHDFDVYQVASSDTILQPSSADEKESSVAGVKHSTAETGSSRANRKTRPPAAPPVRETQSIVSRIVSGRNSVAAARSSNAGVTRSRNQVPSSPNPNRRATKKGRDSVADIDEATNPGQVVESMSAADFKAISNDEALATFWASDDVTVDDVLVLRQMHHVSWFFEFGDLGLVSRNGKGQIDGYLLGFISSRNQTHAVVHQVAVVPPSRRHGVGTKLYMKFQQLCEQRGCTLTRALVQKDNAEVIAFHRALGFEEIDAETDRLAELGGDHLVFAKSYETNGGKIVARLSNNNTPVVNGEGRRGAGF